MGGLREDFAALAAAGERTDLARAALAIARIAYPDLDVAPYLRQLDDLAAAVRPRFYPQASPEAAVTELAGYLFGECGEVLPQAPHSRLSASTRSGPLHQRGSQSSTTLPSGSRIQSWGPPKWR